MLHSLLIPFLVSLFLVILLLSLLFFSSRYILHLYSYQLPNKLFTVMGLWYRGAS